MAENGVEIIEIDSPDRIGMSRVGGRWGISMWKDRKEGYDLDGFFVDVKIPDSLGFTRIYHHRDKEYVLLVMGERQDVCSVFFQRFRDLIDSLLMIYPSSQLPSLTYSFDVQVSEREFYRVSLKAPAGFSMSAVMVEMLHNHLLESIGDLDKGLRLSLLKDENEQKGE